MRTFDDTTKYNSHRIGKKGQLSVRHLKAVKREPMRENSPETTKFETKVSNGATIGDLVEESEPLNLNFEKLLSAQQSSHQEVDKESSSSSFGGDFDQTALDSDAGGGETKTLPKRKATEAHQGIVQNKHQLRKAGASVQVKTAGPQGLNLSHFDASIKIFNNDEYSREELSKVDEVPNMVLRLEIGASIFD